MPQFCRSASNKALLAEIWEGRITIVSEQGAHICFIRRAYTRHSFLCKKVQLELDQKKEELFQKLACIVHDVHCTWFDN